MLYEGLYRKKRGKIKPQGGLKGGRGVQSLKGGEVAHGESHIGIGSKENSKRFREKTKGFS